MKKVSPTSPILPMPRSIDLPNSKRSARSRRTIVGARGEAAALVDPKNTSRRCSPIAMRQRIFLLGITQGWGWRRNSREFPCRAGNQRAGRSTEPETSEESRRRRDKHLLGKRFHAPRDRSPVLPLLRLKIVLRLER